MTMMIQKESMMKKYMTVLATASTFLFVSMATWAKSADDIIGKWKVISHLDGAERAIVKIDRNKKNNTYYARIIKRDDKRHICYKCPKPFTDKPIKGLIMVWNVKPTKKNPHYYKGGYGINPWNGRMFQGEFRLSGKRKDILRLKGFPLESKVVSSSFTWLRVQ